MFKLYYWLIMSIASSVIGTAFATWFENTHLGIWFYAKVDQIMNWAAKRYNLEVLKTENRFKQRYPTMYKRIEDLENKIKE